MWRMPHVRKVGWGVTLDLRRTALQIILTGAASHAFEATVRANRLVPQP